jgi:hypothetical protein
METCPDLNVFGMAQKVSAIVVVKTPELCPSYVWVRGEWNGKGKTATYMPRHWERVRAAGNDNSVNYTKPIVLPVVPFPIKN